MSIAIDRDQAFLAAIRRIADEVAAPNADDVDRNARFPAETVEALRAERAFSAYIPEEYGGGGVSFEAIAAACFELGRRCGASAMVFAMHQIQIAAIARHVEGAAWFEAYLRDVAREQRLVASVTSEIGTGGDIGKSIASVQPGDDGLATFEKQAPTVSYGAYADDLLTTLRRAPDAEPGDQVVVLTHRDQHTLEQTGTWDPMGMRGTCSPGYVVRGDLPDRAGPADPVLDASARNRWCRSRTSCGPTCGSASRPTPSTGRGPSSAPRPRAGPTSCRRRPFGCHS